jgi:hypothetical protein
MKLEFAHINPDENHNFNVENLSWSVNNNLEKIEFYLEMIIKLLKDNVEEALEYSKGTSQLYDTPREGIVCRNSDNNSFKAINPEFLIKYNL